MQLSVRGILSKQNTLKRLMTEIKMTYQLDIILLAETWLKKSTKNQVKIPGYDLAVPTGNVKKEVGWVSY